MELKALECRVEPVKCTKYRIEQPGSNTVKSKKKKEYDYYICDYCKESIILYKDRIKRNGGIARFPITSYKKVTLALHDKCLKPVRKIFNDTYGTNV